MIRYRTPESVMKRINAMKKKGEVILDHGVGSYEFDHYEYEPPGYKNGWRSKLDIFYKDFDKAKTVRLYMSLTEDNLRKPKKDDWYIELVSCRWDKKYPTLLEIREYTVY